MLCKETLTITDGEVRLRRLRRLRPETKQTNEGGKPIESRINIRSFRAKVTGRWPQCLLPGFLESIIIHIQS